MNNQLPKIIGISLLVLSMAVYNYLGSFVVAVVLAGLVLVISDKKKASSEFSRFLKSFRLINKRFVLIAFYDMLCLGVFFFVVPLFSAWFTKSIAGVASVSSLLYVLLLLWIYFFAVTLVLLVAYSVFKGLIWLAILKKKPGARFFKRFFLLNLCWWLVLVIPFFITFFGVKQYYLFYAVVFFAVVYTHLTSVMHYVFTRDFLVGRALKQAFVLGLVRFKEFLVPYSFIVVVYLVLLQVFWFVPKDTKTVLFVSLLFTVFFPAWYRLYLSKVVGSL